MLSPLELAESFKLNDAQVLLQPPMARLVDSVVYDSKYIAG